MSLTQGSPFCIQTRRQRLPLRGKHVERTAQRLHVLLLRQARRGTSRRTPISATAFDARKPPIRFSSRSRQAERFFFNGQRILVVDLLRVELGLLGFDLGNLGFEPSDLQFVLGGIDADDRLALANDGPGLELRVRLGNPPFYFGDGRPNVAGTGGAKAQHARHDRQSAAPRSPAAAGTLPGSPPAAARCDRATTANKTAAPIRTGGKIRA